jgi:hypothetical protein
MTYVQAEAAVRMARAELEKAFRRVVATAAPWLLRYGFTYPGFIYAWLVEEAGEAMTAACPSGAATLSGGAVTKLEEAEAAEAGELGGEVVQPTEAATQQGARERVENAGAASAFAQRVLEAEASTLHGPAEARGAEQLASRYA